MSDDERNELRADLERKARNYAIKARELDTKAAEARSLAEAARKRPALHQNALAAEEWAAFASCDIERACAYRRAAAAATREARAL